MEHDIDELDADEEECFSILYFEAWSFLVDIFDVDDDDDDDEDGEVDEGMVEEVPLDDATAAAIEYWVSAFMNQLLLLLLLLFTLL